MPYSSNSIQKAYQRDWIKERRSEFLKEKACAICGSVSDLEIDHIDPSNKSMPIATVWSKTALLREKELAKCQVLCKKCHLVKTSEWRKSKRKPLVHGTKHGYGVWDCRCTPCKKAHNEDNRARANRRKVQV